MPYVQSNTHSLHYADSHPSGTPPNGTTFIFIHGLGSSQNYYFPVLPYLTEKNRCITVDTYGAARSSYTDEPVSITGIAEDVIGVLDALSIPKAVVVGHSMGGPVVSELGARYPDRVQGIVAIGPIHPSEALVSVMEKRAATVLNGEFYFLKLMSTVLIFYRGNGTHGEFYPDGRRRVLQHPAPSGFYPRAPAWAEP